MAQIKNIVEKNNMEVRLKKSHTIFENKTHTILTDDVFTYVDFYYKTHKKRLISENSGKPIVENYEFYWQQAKHFYNAARQLPIESSPLSMYYAMLNAAKSLILYRTKNVDQTLKNLSNHGLHEYNNEENEKSNNCLNEIYIERFEFGVFVEFSELLDESFTTKWKSKKEHARYSVKELLYQLAFIHRAYVTTYELPRNQELFMPLVPGTSPTFYKFTDGKQYLVFDLQKNYFKASAINIPKEFEESIPEMFSVYGSGGFKIVSNLSISMNNIKTDYSKYKREFQYIVSPNRLWYLKRKSVNGEKIENINSLSLIIAITHRFSEIVRYKPEQLNRLLSGKENWIIHEFLHLAMDQFFDEIACEITGLEIMNTRCK